MVNNIYIFHAFYKYYFVRIKAWKKQNRTIKMKSNNFYNISSEIEFYRKVNHIKLNVEDFTNSNNKYVNVYYYYLLLKNFSLKIHCKNSKLKKKVLEGLLDFLSRYKKMYDFDYISKKHNIFVDIYLLNLNDFKMFYTFK